MDRAILSAKAARVARLPARLVERVAKPFMHRAIWYTCWTLVWTLVIWDFYLAFTAPPGNTWSEVLRAASTTNQLLPWLLGALVGHVFHHDDKLTSVLEPQVGESIFLFATLAVLLVSVGPSVTMGGWQTLLATAGAATAYLFWPYQRAEEWQW